TSCQNFLSRRSTPPTTCKRGFVALIDLLITQSLLFVQQPKRPFGTNGESLLSLQLARLRALTKVLHCRSPQRSADGWPGPGKFLLRHTCLAEKSWTTRWVHNATGFCESSASNSPPRTTQG